MTRLLLLLLIPALWGCATTRREASSARTQIVDKTEADLTQTRGKDSTAQIAEEFAEAVSRSVSADIAIIEYDTAKAADSAGRHPVKREIRVRASGGSERHRQAAAHSAIDLHESDAATDRSKYDLSLENEAVQTVKTKKSVAWWVWAASILAGVWVVCKLRRK